MKPALFFATVACGGSFAIGQTANSPSPAGGLLFRPAPAPPAALTQEDDLLRATSLGRVDITRFRTDDPTIFAEPVDASGGAAFGVCWDNGAADDVTAHQSQETDIGNFYAADDVFVKDGQVKYVKEVCVCFLVSDTIDGTMFKPEVGLRILGDCNGRPDDSSVFMDIGPLTVGIDDGVTGTLVGPCAAFPGFNEWEFCFKGLHATYFGGARYWIVPYGVADITGPGGGLYYWRSANYGLIQGAQGQLQSNGGSWFDAQDCDCPGICTDFCFRIIGDRCCVLKDNEPADIASGSPSLQLIGASIDTARAADNFQIPPSDEPHTNLCAITAYMATNCAPDKVFLEIYENDCNCPGAKLCTIDPTDDADGDGKADFPFFYDTSVDYLGCSIYRLVWPELQYVELETGKNYWVSVVAKGTGSILDKAYWMHKLPVACADICITEGKVKNPYVEGLEDWTPVSQAHAKNGHTGRDFAFVVYASVGPPPATGVCCFEQVFKNGTVVPECVDTDEASCSSVFAGVFHPDEQCASFACPPGISGACCYLSEVPVCTEDFDHYACLAAGGEFHAGLTCSEVICNVIQANDEPAPVGAGPAPQRRTGVFSR